METNEQATEQTGERTCLCGTCKWHEAEQMWELAHYSGDSITCPRCGEKLSDGGAGGLIVKKVINLDDLGDEETEQTERVECPLADAIQAHADGELDVSNEELEGWSEQVQTLATENADLRAQLAEAEGRAVLPEGLGAIHWSRGGLYMIAEARVGGGLSWGVSAEPYWGTVHEQGDRNLARGTAETLPKAIAAAEAAQGEEAP